MVLGLRDKFSLQWVKVSRLILISGLLTFLYLVELCIGMRTVYFVFNLWNDLPYEIRERNKQYVSWTLCVACLMVAVAASFTVNLLSAVWEQKQLEEQEKAKNAIRFAFHMIVTGMIWRYIALWFNEKKEFQKKETLLLTITKFLFTQCFTVPMVIIHISVLGSLDELIFDVCSVLCVSLNLILTCTVFSWCENEVAELKKWNFETVDLVPLIFQSNTPNNASNGTEGISTISKDAEADQKDKNTVGDKLEEIILKFLVLFQTFGFSYGRLLALGILMKLAGIYAVSIMFLQLLASVIYLKFQAPFLVSDCLPKWRQLTRLVFMSYNLMFEWHLNRDPKTGYDFSSNMKHSILYYCIATVESVFYLVTWGITATYSSRAAIVGIRDPRSKFVRTIIISGSLSLVFSLTIHMILLFWQSRRISRFFNSFRRRCMLTKLRMSAFRSTVVSRNVPSAPVGNPPRIDISAPIQVDSSFDLSSLEKQSPIELEKHNSYRDLREPLDDEIEIYGCKEKYLNADQKSFAKNGDNNFNGVILKPNDIETASVNLFTTVNKGSPNKYENEFQTNSENISQELTPSKEIEETKCVTPNKEICESSNEVAIYRDKVSTESTKESPAKSKITLFSESVTQQWNKISMMSNKLNNNMRVQIKKRKDQFQNLRSKSVKDIKSAEPQPDSISPPKQANTTKVPNSSFETSGNPENDHLETSKADIDASEGYFVGDARCYEEEVFKSVQVSNSSETIPKIREPKSKVDAGISNNSEDTQSLSGENHCEGDFECPCYICKMLGDGRLHRRRSSSVPPPERKVPQKPENTVRENKTIFRYLSSPNIRHSVTPNNTPSKDLKSQKLSSPPEVLPKPDFKKFNLAPPKNRAEQYV